MRKSDILYPLLGAAVFAADYAAKKKMRKKPLGREQQLAGGHVVLRHLENGGAVLGTGRKHPALIRNAALGLTVFTLIVYVLTLGRAGLGLLKTGLSLILGGAAGNILDRVQRGTVTDYVSFDIGLPALRKIVFNLADLGIFIGVIMAVIGAPE